MLKKVNFVCLFCFINDFFVLVLRDIFFCYYLCLEDVQEKIRKIYLEDLFKKDMSKIFDGDGYEKCDILFFYKFIRNIC